MYEMEQKKSETGKTFRDKLRICLANGKNVSNCMYIMQQDGRSKKYT